MNSFIEAHSNPEMKAGIKRELISFGIEMLYTVIYYNNIIGHNFKN